MYGPSISAPPARRPPVGYWIAAALFVLAVACGVLAGVGFASLGRQIDSFQRVQVPGQTTVTFSKPGGYLIFFEGPGFGGLSATGKVPLSILSDASGQQVSIAPLSGTQETYTLGGRSGQAVASFTITTPGRYVVHAGAPSNPAPSDIAFGHGIGSTLTVAILGFVFGLLALLAAIAVTIVTAVLRRRRARRPLYAGPPGPPWPGGPPGPPWPGGPQGPYGPPQQPYGQYPWPPPNDPQR